MTILVGTIIVMLFLQTFQAQSDARQTRELLQDASTLNVERLDQIVRRLEVIEMHLVDMPKVDRQGLPHL